VNCHRRDLQKEEIKTQWALRNFRRKSSMKVDSAERSS
jgi:hypothetical protein